MDEIPESTLEMILRDRLALTRTHLGNERTFLAYIRTFIGAYASGVGLIKLTNEAFFIATGYMLIVIAPIILAVGIARLVRVRKKLRIAYLLDRQEEKDMLEDDQKGE